LGLRSVGGKRSFLANGGDRRPLHDFLQNGGAQFQSACAAATSERLVLIDALMPHQKKTFTTNSVELNKSHLTGHWYYSGGERIKAEDTLTGIWVRVYQSGQVIGEYANPSFLSTEQWQ
jgi:hypothetical protein